MFGRRSQRDFEDEIRSHLQMEVDRLEAQGMSPADAERAARRTFGNVGVAEDRFHDAQPFAWLENAGRDMRHAWRSLLRTPAFLVLDAFPRNAAVWRESGRPSGVRANVGCDDRCWDVGQLSARAAGEQRGSDHGAAKRLIVGLYSYRSAAIGSMRLARLAGMKPAANATSANVTAASATTAGSFP